MKILRNFSIFLIFITPLIFPIFLRNNFSVINTDNPLENFDDITTSDTTIDSYIIPGVTGPLNPNQVIKIGLLDDINAISGMHSWNGAFLAAKEINLAGGIVINGTQYYVGIVAENTDEANPILDISKAVAATDTMLNEHDPHFIIGGYRTEALMAYLELVMDYGIPFIGTGCETDIFCENVISNYTRYKYFFRVMPINGTSALKELIIYITALSNFLGIEYSGTVNKVAILREDLSWTIPISSALNYYLSMTGISVVEEIAFPVTATFPDYLNYMAQIQASGAQILIPIISALECGSLMDYAYNQYKPKCLIAGINKFAKLESYWDITQGACQYEIVMQNTYRTNKTEMTIPFWDAYLNEFDIEPFYTGIGAYDAIRLLAYAVNFSQSLESNDIISTLEMFNIDNSYLGASGNIAFLQSHDLVEGWPYATNLFCQWQLDGFKQVITSVNLIYPDSIVRTELSLPYWGINNLTEEEYLPGDFTLMTNADNPDKDGNFTLSWTESIGAESYSLYCSDTPITYISQNLDLISHQYDTSPFEMTDRKTGDHYFIIASYNASGERLSNCIYVNVSRPRPGPFTLTSNATNPDIDGNFSLSWTSSEGAINYSIYKHTDPITEINDTLEVLAYQNATSPFLITEFADGIYYYIVEAVNATGETLSNVVSVNVSFPPPDHDLGVYLEIPVSIKVNTSYIINASVKNLGLNDEINVQFFLHLNTILVDSAYVSYLPSGATEIINFEWKPTQYEIYNFTVYAPPVAGELFYTNNLVSSLIYVRESALFDGMYIKYKYSSLSDSNVTYVHDTNGLFNETLNLEYMGITYSYTWSVDSLTRLMSGGSIFVDGCNTPFWIFTNTSLYDTIPIAVDGEGNHDFYVIRELVYDLPGFGPVEVWEMEDLTLPGGTVWYEKSTGILLNGTFFYASGGISNYTFDFVDTNAQIKLLYPGNFLLSSNAGDPEIDGGFDLNWTVSSGATNYSVYRYSNYITEINGSLTLLADEINNLSLALSGYSDGTYYLIVVAHNDYGDTFSNCLSVIVEIPVLPGDFILSSDAEDPDPDGTFNLTWAASSDATNYSVYRYSNCITEINGSLILLADEIIDLSLALSGYSEGIYYFIAVAHNDDGDTLSNCLSVIVEIPILPGYFILSSNAENPDTDGNFDLTWTVSSDANNYSVYRYSNYITEINGSLILLADEITDLSLALSGYSDGTYYFIAVAHNDYGDTLSNNLDIGVAIQQFKIHSYSLILILLSISLVLIELVKNRKKIVIKS